MIETIAGGQVIMDNKTEIRYRLTWKSDTQRTPKVAHFPSRGLSYAEEWYEEKLSEGKNPQLWKIKTTTTFEVMRPLHPIREEDK